MFYSAVFLILALGFPLSTGAETVGLPDAEPLRTQHNSQAKALIPACNGHNLPALADYSRASTLGGGATKKEFYGAIIETLRGATTRQIVLAKNITGCLNGEIDRNRCAPVFKLVEEVLPEAARRARQALTIGHRAGTPPPVFERDLTAPNLDLRSPGGHGLEHWSKASDQEAVFAIAVLLKSKQYIETELRRRDTSGNHDLNRWHTLAQGMEATRLQYQDEYYSIIGSYPILLRFKDENFTQNDVLAAVNQTWRDANATHGKLTEVSRRLERNSEFGRINSMESEYLLSDMAAVAKTVSQSPEFCPFAEAYLSEKMTQAKIVGAVQMTAIVGLSLVDPWLGLAAMAGVTGKDVYSGSRELTAAENLLRGRIINLSGGIQESRLEDLERIRHQIASGALMSMLGSSPAGLIIAPLGLLMRD